MTGSARRRHKAIEDVDARVVATGPSGDVLGAVPRRESACLSFSVPGPLVTWKRTTIYGGRRLTPKAQREYQQRVYFAACLAVASASGWSRDRRYAVDIVWTPPDRRRADVDNCAKTVLDSLNGCVWLDDSQVDDLRVRRAEPSRSGACVVVRVTAMENKSA